GSKLSVRAPQPNSLQLDPSRPRATPGHRCPHQRPIMTEQTQPLILSSADNVAILTARAAQGARPLGIGEGLQAPVMSGHKIARGAIATRAPITKCCQIIGYASQPIAAGEHVHTHNCAFGAHDQDYHIGADLAAARAAIPQVAPSTFMGY